jgi:hypothetical protein
LVSLHEFLTINFFLCHSVFTARPQVQIQVPHRLSDKSILADPSMGCGASRDPGVGRQGRPKGVGEVVVFLPGLRVPRTVDFSQSLGDHLDKSTVERLSALRARVVEMAMQESATALKPRRKAASTRHGV